MTTEEEIKKLKKLLVELIEYAPGIYPKEFNGEKRTEFGDGWNKGVMEYSEESNKILNKHLTKEYINSLPWTPMDCEY